MFRCPLRRGTHEGQARRRKLAGNYPAQHDFEAVRKFWSSHDPGPVSEFSAPPGTVAITFDVTGALPMTWLFDAARLVELEAKAEAEMRSSRVGSYRSFVRGLAAVYVEERPRQAEKMMFAIGLCALWSALNHPEQGPAMREKLSQCLRRGETAHITWYFNPQHGLGLALAERFVDLGRALSLAPQNCVISYPPTSTGAAQEH